MLLDDSATQLMPRNLRPNNLRLRRVTRAHATLGRRSQAATAAREGLAEVCAALSRQVGPFEIDARLVESRVEAAKWAPPYCAFAALDLADHGERGALALELGLVVALLQRLAGAVPVAAPAAGLTRFEQVAFGYLVLVALAGWRTHPAGRSLPLHLAGVGCEPRVVTAGLDGRAPYLEVDLSVRAGESRGGGRLLLPASAVNTAVLRHAPAVRPLPQHPSGQLRLRLRVGRTTLERADLAAIAVGDVVMTPTLRGQPTFLDGEAELVSPHFSLTGKLRGSELELVGASKRHPEVHPMHPADEALDDGLPIEVVVELTRVTVPLADLVDLRPGRVLTLAVDGTQPVLLRLGERAFARAELVDIEDAVGVRVLELL